MKTTKLTKRNRNPGIERGTGVGDAMKPIRLDFGCGPHKREGFKGVDCINFAGVDYVMNVAVEPWPWPDNSVEEAHASHFLEHLEAKERWHFFNELYRVLKPGAKCAIVTPDWASQRAYGDMTHKWPPVSGFFWLYLNRDWRMGNPNAVPPQAANAPHTDAQYVKGGLNCHFGAQWGWTIDPRVSVRNQEYQQHAIDHFRDACMDMVCTLTKA